MPDFLTITLSKELIFIIIFLQMVILPVIIKISMMFYYKRINKPITEFIENLPHESYIIYQNNQFFIRFLKENNKLISHHQKIKMLEITEEPINIPIKLKEKFLKFNKMCNSLNMVKKDNNFFVTQYLLKLETVKVALIFSFENNNFKRTSSINRLFKDIIKKET